MAAELEKFISSQLGRLPMNHPDRQFIQRLENFTQNHLVSAERVGQMAIYEKMVEEAKRRKEQKPEPDFIVDTVANYYSFTPEALKGRSRKKELVVAKKALVFLLVDHSGFNISETARFLERNHSTIIHHYREAECLLDSDLSFAESMFILGERIYRRDPSNEEVDSIVGNGITNGNSATINNLSK